MNVAYLPSHVNVKCPYCGFINKILVQFGRSTSRPEATYCDSEEGGCDRLFAVKLTVSISQEIFTMQEVPMDYWTASIDKEEA